MNENTPVNEKLPTEKELRAAINHTTARLTNLRSSLRINNLKSLAGSRIVADSPHGDLFVCVRHGVKLSFMYAPLARSSEIASFDSGEEYYLESLKSEFDAKPPGTDLTNLRFLSKREFNAALIPILEEIISNTKQTLNTYGTTTTNTNGTDVQP